jgi:hypothetical protein
VQMVGDEVEEKAVDPEPLRRQEGLGPHSTDT